MESLDTKAGITESYIQKKYILNTDISYAKYDTTHNIFLFKENITIEEIKNDILAEKNENKQIYDTYYKFSTFIDYSNNNLYLWKHKTNDFVNLKDSIQNSDICFGYIPININKLTQGQLVYTNQINKTIHSDNDISFLYIQPSKIFRSMKD